VLAAIVTLAACGGSGEATTTLPALTLRPLDGDGASLEVGDVTGPAVVNLWATWCAPCRKELPAFQEVSEDRPDVRFIGVDIAEDAAKARDYLDELGVTFEQYLDDRGELTDALGTAALPVTLVIGTDGAVTSRHVGPMTVDDLGRALDDVTR
jgi:thiol-disulfide isomerase/thioredoxin